MISNSVILAYRNRPQHLVLFLAAIAQCHHAEPYEIVIVDLGSKGTEQVIPFIDLPIRYHWIDYAGVFWKSKAINYGARNARGEFITVLDVDCLPVASFLDGIEAFYADESKRDKKLGFNVRYTDPSTGRYATEKGFEWVQSNVLAKPEKFPNKFYTTYERVVTGNSQMTLRRDVFLGLGGMDERFCGYGWEDHEFNLRACGQLGATEIHPTSELFHLWHAREATWENDAACQATRARFFRAQAAGFPVLRRGEGWGQFVGR